MKNSCTIDPESLDWGEIWKNREENSVCHEKPSNEEKTMMKNLLTETYPSILLERLTLEPEWTLLDMGCGEGKFAIPIAKKVRRVLAIDQSESDIKRADEFARREGVRDNITFVNMKLQDAIQSKNIEPCDGILASRSVGLIDRNVKRELTVIDSLAKRRVFLTVSNGDGWPLYVGAFAAIGKEYRRTIWSPVILNTLWQMRIRPNVDHFTSQGMLGYDSIDHATQNLSLIIKYYHNNGRSLAAQETKRLHDFLEDSLSVAQDGKYYCDEATMGWDLIWWDK